MSKKLFCSWKCGKTDAFSSQMRDKLQNDDGWFGQSRHIFPAFESCLTAHWLWPPLSKPFTQTLHLEMSLPHPYPLSIWKAHCYHPLLYTYSKMRLPLPCLLISWWNRNMRPYIKIDMIHCYETICFIRFELNTRPSPYPLVILVSPQIKCSPPPTNLSKTVAVKNQTTYQCSYQVTFLFLHKRRYYGVWKKSFIFGKKKVQMQYFFRIF